MFIFKLLQGFWKQWKEQSSRNEVPLCVGITEHVEGSAWPGLEPQLSWMDSFAP